MNNTLSKAVTTLPTNGDINSWNESEKAIVEASGLVFVDKQSNQRELAPRSVVEAFLYQCRRTGLDPLSRQIYCIPRKSKGSIQWTTQVSIDGFRVIAEQSGEYAGQGDIEWFTSEREWVDVFIPVSKDDHPLAARASVYRKGFDQPIRAVANWDAYAQTDYNGNVTSMWSKMGALMLGKCAEALALRKAFPQDLSGLYTSDEMSQATIESGTSEATATPIVSTPKEPSKNWRELGDEARSADAVLAVYQECRDLGELDLMIDLDGVEISTREFLTNLGKSWRDLEQNPDLDNETVEAELIEVEND
jgi:phage recombination protein Bet